VNDDDDIDYGANRQFECECGCEASYLDYDAELCRDRQRCLTIVRLYLAEAEKCRRREDREVFYQALVDAVDKNLEVTDVDEFKYSPVYSAGYRAGRSSMHAAICSLLTARWRKVANGVNPEVSAAFRELQADLDDLADDD
jgi:hypothetical protein